MTVLIDTSALYALLDEDDANHVLAVRRWSRLLATELPHRLGLTSERTRSRWRQSGTVARKTVPAPVTVVPPAEAGT